MQEVKQRVHMKKLKVKKEKSNRYKALEGIENNGDVVMSNIWEEEVYNKEVNNVKPCRHNVNVMPLEALEGEMNKILMIEWDESVELNNHEDEKLKEERLMIF